MKRFFCLIIAALFLVSGFALDAQAQKGKNRRVTTNISGKNRPIKGVLGTGAGAGSVYLYTRNGRRYYRTKNGKMYYRNR